MSDEKSPFGSETKQEQRRGRSAAERTTLIISILVLVIVVAAITYSYLSKDTLPVGVTVNLQADKAEKHAGEYYLPLEIVNDGSSVAESVRVTVTHTVDGQTEDSELMVEFLPGQARQEAYVALKNDPATGTLETDVGSYLKP